MGGDVYMSSRVLHATDAQRLPAHSRKLRSQYGATTEMGGTPEQAPTARCAFSVATEGPTIYD
jgi:hypothetical protein